MVGATLPEYEDLSLWERRLRRAEADQEATRRANARRCPECDESLGPDADRRRIYCSRTCANRVNDRKRSVAAARLAELAAGHMVKIAEEPMALVELLQAVSAAQVTIAVQLQVRF
jgi:hypothetical protein